MQTVLAFAADARLSALLPRLRACFGGAALRQDDPVRQLVYSLIGHGVAPSVGLAVFRRVTTAYPSLADLAAAAPDALERYFVGLPDAAARAAALPAALQAIAARAGGYDLSLLARLSTEQARRWLLELPGVTAAHADAVLTLSALRRAGVAVDADSARPVRRLGLAEAGAPLSALGRQVGERAPASWQAEDFAALTIGLARLARTACHAGTPDCGACPVADLCPSSRARPATVLAFPARAARPATPQALVNS